MFCVQAVEEEHGAAVSGVHEVGGRLLVDPDGPEHKAALVEAKVLVGLGVSLV